MVTRILLILLGVLLLGASATAATPEERFQTALAVLNAKCGDFCGFGLEDDPSEAKALDALWDATQDWTLAFLESNPGIAIGKLKTELLNRHPMMSEAARIAPAWVTLLAQELYAFSTNWGETGNVFLVGKREGRWAVLWDVRNGDPGRFEALKAWRTGAARPLYGNAFALKPDSQGHVRFGLDATYAQAAGFTVASQISIWSWDGRNAEPLLVETYLHALDDVVGGANPVDRVVVRVKDDFNSVQACGACVGRQFDWTFRILPDRIVDEGKKPLYPEADAVDAVYHALQEHRPAAGAGTPAALAFMMKNVPDGLGNFVTRRNKAGATVCLSADSFESFFGRFHVVRREGRFFIDKAERAGGDISQRCDK